MYEEEPYISRHLMYDVIVPLTPVRHSVIIGRRFDDMSNTEYIYE